MHDCVDYVHADMKAENILFTTMTRKVSYFDLKNNKMKMFILQPTETAKALDDILHDRVVMTDFGLARKIVSALVYKEDKKKGLLLSHKFMFNKPFPQNLINICLAHEGTLPYTSLDAHVGTPPSYRGDLEVVVYNLCDWLVGHVPWFAFTDGERVMVWICFQKLLNFTNKRRNQSSHCAPTV
jgi:serine/threonine protein kinase